ncbi:hypothetical protein TRIUR3_14031 [Triticum urartu]|uniref:Uncharacterized protein n=1 Tax=Triticum urartu TaxID=4572 RepID=M8APA1_TRIUA|nr:hypothetical protein TRIUR3_14031 [Triticum urartu]
MARRCPICYTCSSAVDAEGGQAASPRAALPLGAAGYAVLPSDFFGHGRSAEFSVQAFFLMHADGKVQDESERTYRRSSNQILLCSLAIPAYKSHWLRREIDRQIEGPDLRRRYRVKRTPYRRSNLDLIDLPEAAAAAAAARVRAGAGANGLPAEQPLQLPRDPLHLVHVQQRRRLRRLRRCLLHLHGEASQRDEIDRLWLGRGGSQVGGGEEARMACLPVA